MRSSNALIWGRAARPADATAVEADDRPCPEHHRRRDDRLVLRTAGAWLHPDFRRDAQARLGLWPVHHDWWLFRNRPLLVLWGRAARGCERRGSRGGDRRNLCREALFRADESRRRHRINGVQFRDLDAARAGGDPGLAPPYLSLSTARNRRAARIRALPGTSRSPHHAGLRARTGGGRASRALSHA